MFRALRSASPQTNGHLCALAVVVHPGGLAGMPPGVAIAVHPWPAPAAPYPPQNRNGAGCTAERSFTACFRSMFSAADGAPAPFGTDLAANKARMETQREAARASRRARQTGPVAECLGDPAAGVFVAPPQAYYRAVSHLEAAAIAESIARGDGLPTLSGRSRAEPFEDAEGLLAEVKTQVANGSYEQTSLTSFTSHPGVAVNLSKASTAGSKHGGAVIEMTTEQVPPPNAVMLDIGAARGLKPHERDEVARLSEHLWVGPVTEYRVVYMDGAWSPDCDLATVQRGGGGPEWDGRFNGQKFGVTNATITDEMRTAVTLLGGTISQNPVTHTTDALICGTMLHGRGEDTIKARAAIARGIPLITLATFMVRVAAARKAAIGPPTA